MTQNSHHVRNIQTQKALRQSRAGTAAATAVRQMKIEEALNSLASTLLSQHSAGGRLRMVEKEKVSG